MDELILTETEVALALSLGIKFHKIPVGNGQVRMETYNRIKFEYEQSQVKILEYFPDGTRVTHIIEVV